VIESAVGGSEAAVDGGDQTAPVVGITDDSLPNGEPPAAVIDRGGAGREPGVVLCASDSETLLDRTLTVYEALITE
jgi:predicted fused transcriptional regulator/phosphomethylpyrimidine kinase